MNECNKNRSSLIKLQCSFSESLCIKLSLLLLLVSPLTGRGEFPRPNQLLQAGSRLSILLCKSSLFDYAINTKDIWLLPISPGFSFSWNSRRPCQYAIHHLLISRFSFYYQHMAFKSRNNIKGKQDTVCGFWLVKLECMKDVLKKWISSLQYNDQCIG